jgi:hypothetical protein
VFKECSQGPVASGPRVLLPRLEFVDANWIQKWLDARSIVQEQRVDVPYEDGKSVGPFHCGGRNNVFKPGVVKFWS